MARLLAAWDRFWFTGVPAESLGAMRLALGALLVVGHLQLTPELHTLFAFDGPVPAWVHVKSLPWPTWSPYDLARSPAALWALHLAGLVVHGLFMVGWRSRTMGVLSLLFQAATYHRDPFFQHGGDRVMRVATLLMCLGPSGAALSVDAWLARSRALRAGLPAPGPVMVPVVVHRLVAIQWAVIYLHSGLVKGRGGVWHSGEAVYYALSAGQYQRAPWLVEPVLASPVAVELLALGTWLTLGWELGFALLILWRPTRILAIVVGLLVHGGIALLLMVGSFSYIMMWGYLALLDPAWVSWLRGRLRRLAGDQREGQHEAEP